jgi:hypothetical protein
MNNNAQNNNGKHSVPRLMLIQERKQTGEEDGGRIN